MAELLRTSVPVKGYKVLDHGSNTVFCSRRGTVSWFALQSLYVGIAHFTY